MSSIMKISPQGQIRVPKKIMEALKIGNGDYLEVELAKDQIVLKPRKLIDPSQGWYWTKEWQKVEQEIDKEIERGELSPGFKKAEEGLRWLKK
ncbi:MAG TPA: AbrB/MazE/SpoVT family DNA-binding domain-containing protein [Thermodesulfobacteriota bacterium]|nr:AbrB/MazE/SpoVT family DNA-binding domain-containing protein [Thermodesulfobacteriota bacterium]